MSANNNLAVEQCQNCRFKLPSQTATTGSRCGWNHFQVPSIERKPLKMSIYPEVVLEGHRGYWACVEVV
jgi:hypothetical protein